VPSGGGLRAWIQAQTLPFSRRQLKDQPCRMRRDALDHIAQIHERIDLQVLAGLGRIKSPGTSLLAEMNITTCRPSVKMDRRHILTELLKIPASFTKITDW
jgi:hypothetical protein